MVRLISMLFLVLILVACNSRSNEEKEIEKIAIDLKVTRFDKKFAEVTGDNLPQLKSEYPYLFPERFTDSMWIAKANDSIQKELNEEVEKAFPDFSTEEDGIYELFQHTKYYFPSFEIPHVITITSEVDYRNKVLLTPDYLFISLDTYLGKEHPFYIGLQEYLKKNFEKDQILPDVANEIAEVYVPQPESKTFLAHMVYYGKILYLKDLLLSKVADHDKIGYNEVELKWAIANEEEVWRYFVEREVIFNTDTDLNSRFLYPAPFSKFYLELDAESPARLGQFIGWQMIRQYMDKNEVSVQEMLATNAETIFNKANYKPKK
ncbi:gliding motility lipoprotein GldB [Gillisia hiemivivida]|uniref:Gliding motility lipoprotein GldB n=1 Tax=Gillisia hiemivivida TaxID=291190 RepID=A0A5C7A1R7_9FLAO|nr:gliding motility lipoprotein GldB [Gillisia hiemivivida]TXD94890.1 gliding motility lipoprotein GldB [Gillisia hiemivivida]